MTAPTTTPRTLGELIRFATADPLTLPNPFRMWDTVAAGGFLAPPEGLAYFGIPGVDQLEAVAQAAWGEPLTVANLLRIRGRLVGGHDTGPDEADAMALVEVASVFQGGRPATAEQHVTLDHLVALTGLSKKTFERAKNKPGSTMPKPKVWSIGGGTPNRWLWSEVRPWLIEEGFGDDTLPARIPSAVFRKKR